MWNRRSLTERLLSACRCKHKSEGSNVELVGFADYIIMNYSMKNFMTNDKSAHAKGVLNDKR